MALLRRILNVFRPERLDREINEELEFHLQMLEGRFQDRGLNTDEAQTAAKRRMGNQMLAEDEMRDANVVGWLASIFQDLRHGLTLLRRDPGVSGLIILVLALGIGGNAAVFTLLKAAFLDPLPYPDAGKLVTVIEHNGWIPTVSEFFEIRKHARTLQGMAFAQHLDMQISGTGEPTRIFAARVTASFFPLLGVNASLGRTFLEEENQPGSPPVIILSNAFWRSHMGSDPGVIGRTLRLDGQPAVVVGVLPPEFHFDYPTLNIPEPVDLYVPYPIETSLPFQVSANGQGVPVRVIAKLREDVTLAQVGSDMWDIALVLAHENTAPFPGHAHDPKLFLFDAIPLRDAIVGKQSSLLWLLLGGVGVLLLIACANTGQLLLARSLGRSREIAVRVALGASRGRLIRQFFLEGMVLALCGGAAGLLAAGWIAHLLVSMLPVRSPLLACAHLDGRAVGFTLAVSMISAILFSIIPAVKGSRWTPGSSLGARASTGEGNRWRHAMIAIEAALSVFLWCGAGLVVQNLRALISQPMGFDPHHVLAMRLQLPSGKPNHPDPKAGMELQQYLEKIEAVPGVDSAATVTGPPLRPARGGGPIQLVAMSDPGLIAWAHDISPNYFRTMGIPLLAGRAFRLSDAEGAPRVAIVNQAFARHFGLGPNVVGRQIDNSNGPVTIIGMAGNVRMNNLETLPFPEVYGSFLQFSWPNVYLMVRSGLPAGQLLKQVKAAIESANPGQAVFGAETMDDVVTESTSQQRFNVFLIGAFALLALGMSVAGIYGVISFLVSQRSSEIAIRLALGARQHDIIMLILGNTSLWVTAGLAMGLCLGLAAGKTLRALTDVESAPSPGMYAAVIVFFFAATLIAAYLPARRALKLDPAVALRSE